MEFVILNFAFLALKWGVNIFESEQNIKKILFSRSCNNNTIFGVNAGKVFERTRLKSGIFLSILMSCRKLGEHEHQTPKS